VRMVSAGMRVCAAGVAALAQLAAVEPVPASAPAWPIMRLGRAKTSTTSTAREILAALEHYLASPS